MILKTFFLPFFLFVTISTSLYSSEKPNELSPIIKTKTLKKSPFMVRRNKHAQKNHLSVEITPPNSPEFLARAQVSHENNKNSYSIKITTRPSARIMNALADQIKSEKKINITQAPEISVELCNLSDDQNSDLNKLMVNFFKTRFLPNTQDYPNTRTSL